MDEYIERRDLSRRDRRSQSYLVFDNSAKALWSKGSFFLVAFAATSGVIKFLASKMDPSLVGLSVFGTMVFIYLLAVVLGPPGRVTEKGLLLVLQEYVRRAFRARPDKPEDRH